MLEVQLDLLLASYARHSDLADQDCNAEETEGDFSLPLISLLFASLVFLIWDLAVGL